VNSIVSLYDKEDAARSSPLHTMNKLRKKAPSSTPAMISSKFNSTMSSEVHKDSLALDSGGSAQPPAQSRTMMFARTTIASDFSPRVTSVDTALRVPREVQPVSASEHYWAARAVNAEALLTASTAHRREIYGRPNVKIYSTRSPGCSNSTTIDTLDWKDLSSCS